MDLTNMLEVSPMHDPTVQQNRRATNVAAKNPSAAASLSNLLKSVQDPTAVAAFAVFLRVTVVANGPQLQAW